jgi:thiol:disulfide interchange protein DsbD
MTRVYKTGRFAAGLAAAALLAGCSSERSTPGDVQASAREVSSRAALVSRVKSVQPGQPFLVGILISLPEGWHTYWSNPGDAGMAPTVTWRPPEGVTIGPLMWPYPQRFDDPPLVSFGYEKEVLLMAEAKPSADLGAGQTVTVGCDVSWLICKDACVIQNATLELALPVGGAVPETDGRWQDVFSRTEKTLPQHDARWQFRTRSGDETLTLLVAAPDDTPPEVLVKSVFFPFEGGIVDFGTPVSRSSSGRRYSLVMAREADGEVGDEGLTGVLVLPKEASGKGRARALIVRAPLSGGT